MAKFSVDFNELDPFLTKKAYKLSEVADRIEKVGFDVVKFKDGTFDELWRVEEGDDGPYIVALYKDEEVKIVTAAAPGFSIICKNSDLNIFYKGEFLCKVAASSVGFSKQDINLAAKYLPTTLASNKKLRHSLFNQANSLKTILAKYPELA